ncbi:molybdopterin molybdenumtransferase MoeA [Methylovorus menthalis]|uniref:molybdopterin molybdotransferase MoeA n=1 Tax=Methylovorus menthalis TaxID=1002227 RepID=UPI001E58B36A|nr:gephyrin-like molybdotransferase Glp [Methylovorus menthalis]MCB4810916.1 molybdopterin molybdenumtransferase MoeA [Methylovorus menthalis]
MSEKLLADLARSPSCADDYDPNSMSVERARDYIKRYLSPVSETETLPVRESLGRILASSITSPVNVPNHDNSAMDGYAVRTADSQANGETSLKIVGTAYAGQPWAGTLQAGECVRIMTGAVIPAGADAVIMQERVEQDADTMRHAEQPKPGSNIRRAGEDLGEGEVVLAQGHLMHSADLGLVASLGIGEVSVYRQLKVAFFSTGDELASVGQALQAGQIYDSNRYTLHGMLTRMGVEIMDLGAIKDDPQVLEQVLTKAAAEADVVITSGGVSVGEADYMKQLLQKLGSVLFWKIAMKPGRPLAYGKIGNAHYFGLPGNPVAVMVTFYQFVREAMLVLMGQASPPPLPMLQAICVEEIRKAKGRTEFQRGILFADKDGTWKVKTTGAQGSGMLSSMSRANCFIVLDEDTGSLPANQLVRVQLLEGII